MTFLLLFIAGLLIGSFLNVVSFRYSPDGRIFGWHIMGGRSRCRSCKVELKWYELIPLLSFIIQRAKCRHCYESLSWQYPAVEIVTGFLTAAIPIFFYQYFHLQQVILQGQPVAWYYIFTGLWLIASYTLVVISAIDLRLRIIPDQSNLLLAAIGVVLLIYRYVEMSKFPYQGAFSGTYSAVLGQQSSLFLNALIAVGVALIIFGGVIFFTRGRGMGLGDLKLALPLALLLSWPDAGLAFAFSFMIGGVVGIFLVFGGKKSMKQIVPFGPFLALGTYVAVFYGESILRWYFSLVS